MLQRIVLSWGDDEYLPTFIGVGHNLKHENVFQSKPTILVDMPDYYVMHYKVEEDDKKFDIIVTHRIFGETTERFIRGHLYFNNKEVGVNDHRTYSSLQVGDWCYDKICVFRLDMDPFNN